MTVPTYPTSRAAAIKYAAHLSDLRREPFLPVCRREPLPGGELNFAAIPPSDLPDYERFGWEAIPTPAPRRRA